MGLGRKTTLHLHCLKLFIWSSQLTLAGLNPKINNSE